MTMQKALKDALRDILGPEARAHGYKGTAPTWRKSTSLGDWAIVNVQSSKANTAQYAKCTINLSLVPEAAWDWQRHRIPGLPPIPAESHGLFRERLQPAGSFGHVERWWEMRSIEEARAAVGDMVAQLRENGWPVLDLLLDRDELLARVQKQDLGFFKGPGHEAYFSHAEALLLSDRGPSAELDQALRRNRESATPYQLRHVGEFETWIRRRAASMV